jgi:hypothetical protein
MFISRMPIPYPPAGCNTAYVHDGRVLVVPAGASLLPICVVCGKPSDVAWRKTFHWHQPELVQPGSREMMPLLDDIAFMFRALFRLDDRIALDVPLCSADRTGQIIRTCAGTALIALGVGVIAFSFTVPGGWTRQGNLTSFIGIAMIMGSITFGLSGANAFSLVEYNSAFTAYQGFGVEYMKTVPHASEIFGSKRN